MKHLLLMTITALTLISCADTKNHINPDATSWEKIQYEADKPTHNHSQHESKS